MNPEDIRLINELKKQREMERKTLEALEDDKTLNPFGGIFGLGDQAMFRQKHGEQAYEEALENQKVINAQKRLLRKKVINDALLEGNIRSNGELANPNSSYAIRLRHVQEELGLDERQAIAYLKAQDTLGGR